MSKAQVRAMNSAELYRFAKSEMAIELGGWVSVQAHTPYAIAESVSKCWGIVDAEGDVPEWMYDLGKFVCNM